MALSASSVWSSFDRGTSLADTAVRDVSPIMFAALNLPFGISSRIKIGAPVTSRKAEWVQETLNPNTVTLNATAANVDGSASNTTFAVSTGQSGRLKVGDLIKNKTRGAGGEVMQVTAITSDSDITVTRGFGSTSGSTAHADADVFEIMPADQEGSPAGTDRTRARTTRYNFTQIFSTDVKLSGSMLATNMYNVPDEFTNSVKKRTIEVRKRLDYTVVNGIASAAPSDTVYGTMGGVIEMINTGGDISTPGSAGTNVDSTTTALTYDKLSDLIGTLHDNGNSTGNFLIATNRTEYEVVATWPDSQVRRQYNTTGATYGGFVDKIVTKQGISADVMLTPEVPVGYLLVMDLGRIELNPMQGRAWNMYTNKVGDNRDDFAAARLLGEWTLKMHNADTAHGMMTALAD